MNRTFVSAAALTAGLTVLASVGATAQAEPSDGGVRTYVAVGSDTTQNVMNGLSEVITIGGNKVIASYDAVPTPDQITTRAAGCANLARPSGSGAGYTAVLDSIVGRAGTYAQATAAANTTNVSGCFDIARASSARTGSAGIGGGTMTNIPFASENVTFATLSTSNVPRQLTKGQLKSIYQCSFHAPGALQTIQPLLPQDSSGTRQYFVAQILGGGGTQTIPAAGAGGAVVEGTGTGLGSCVVNKAQDGSDIVEHDGTYITNANQLIPFSTAQYIAQISGFTADNNLGRAALGAISPSASTTSGGVNQTTEPYTSTLYNNPSTGAAGSALKRDVYNVVQTSRITVGGANYDANFASIFLNNVTAPSTPALICAQAATIQKFGFNPSTSCGVAGPVSAP